MALKIRQGLEADRAGFVPESGELIYTTDDKLVYIGDGTTAGGNIISGTTYSISSETVSGGANLRLTGSDASTDNVSFVGSGSVTVSRTDSNTITISGSGGGGGSGTVNSGIAGSLAFYTSNGTTVDDTGPGIFYDTNAAKLSVSYLGAEDIEANSPLFRMINKHASNLITFGGISPDSTEHSGRLRILDKGPFDPANPVIASFDSVHNNANVNALTFFRARGTLASATGINSSGGDGIGAILFVAQTNSAGDVAQVGSLGFINNDSFTPGNSIVPGTFFIQNCHPTWGMQTSFWIQPDLDTYSSRYHHATLGIRTPEIDTDDSSHLTIVPTAVFNSDVEIQNDLVVANKVTADEFISTSTGTPEIYSNTDLRVIANPYTWKFLTNGGLQLPVLTAAPGSPTTGAIYLADNANWDPLSKAGSAPYAVLWNGSAWIPVSGA